MIAFLTCIYHDSHHCLPHSSEAKLAGTAVLVVHAVDRSNGSYKVACIPSSSDARLPRPYFTRWDYTPVPASPPSVVITSEPNYLDVTFDSDPDPPVLRCLSDEPERDVTAIFGKFGGQWSVLQSTKL